MDVPLGSDDHSEATFGSEAGEQQFRVEFAVAGLARQDQQSAIGQGGAMAERSGSGCIGDARRRRAASRPVLLGHAHHRSI